MRQANTLVRSLIEGCAISAALLVALPSLASGVSPVAATDLQKNEATAHFVTGKRALASQNWPVAITELNASVAVVDSPNARLELARALRDSGNLAEAWIAYGQAIENARGLSMREARYAKTAEAGTAERAEVETKIALVSVTVKNAAPDATLVVGGRVVRSHDGSAFEAVPPGDVEVLLTSGGGENLARKTAFAALGARTEIVLDAQPPPEARPAIAAVAAEENGNDRPATQTAQEAHAPEKNGPGLRPLAYAITGAGVAGFASFAAFGVMSNAAYSDLQSACSRGCPPEKRDEIGRGRTEQIIANVSLVAGITGIAAGVTLFLFRVPSDRPPSAALLVGPGFLGVRGSL